MSRRRREEDVAGAQDRNRRHDDNGNVGGAMDQNRRCRGNNGNVGGAMDQNRPIVINADEVVIRANRVIVVDEENRRRDDHHRCGCNRRRSDRRDSFWF